MQTALPHPLLPQFSKLLEMAMGLYYPEKCWADLEHRIAAAAPALGMANTEECIRKLLFASSLTQRQTQILASHLTIGETYFFREKGCFNVLEGRILPELMRVAAREHRQVRIWSAGCCTGEEPYSIAILLDRLSQHTGESNATILATDINPIFLNKAADGVYNEWSFRATPAWIKERYFKPRKNGQFEILPRVRKQVNFSYLNLAEEVYPSIINGTDAMDLIVCRNVFIYFSPDSVMKIGKSFHQSLVKGGWFVLSPVEVSVSSRLFPQFELAAFPDATLYRKTESLVPQETAADEHTVSPPESVDGPAPALASLSYLHGEEMPVSLTGVSAETSKRGTPAISAHAAATGNNPENHEEFEDLCHTAQSYANQGELTEAARWCGKAIAVNKLNPAAHYLLATIWQELGQTPAAKQSLTRALYLDPDFVLAHFTLGHLCMLDDQYREAERHFGNALTLLALRPHDELLPESNGLTTGRLKDVIASARLGIFARLGKDTHSD